MDSGEPATNESESNNRSCQDGDIRIKYHPNSGRELESFRFEEFTRGSSVRPHPEDLEPWAPFKTREDFEFAALAQETGMSKAQVNSLISLFHRYIESGKDSFTISSHDEMRNILKTASEKLSNVSL